MVSENIGMVPGEDEVSPQGNSTRFDEQVLNAGEFNIEELADAHDFGLASRIVGFKENTTEDLPPTQH